ncbi:Alpha/Beta hydrolase protein [Biscogniauxia mediterranea]|nr:Alpha/Beta hydrolase protein [Biscogniauxia mediterranea]
MASRLLAAAFCCLITPAIALPRSFSNGSSSAAPTVTVKNGTYSGIYSPEYNQDFFLGMPYAKKAVRFNNSVSLDTSWNGTRAATSYPLHCIGYGGDEVGYELSEDCLYLNVIRPAGLENTADLPVAVWIHGGGLFMGGSADRRYNLSFIVDNSVKQGTPLVAVSFNYRLSAFGFLSGKEALDAGVTNLGFRDQRLALHWVHENIAAFGGSPDKVTIFGESSGAESVTAQVVAYNGRDDGLFRAAVGESGFGSILNRYPGGLNATERQQETFDNLVRNTSCASTVGTADAIPCLRDLPFDEINYALNVTSVGPWPPCLDGDFLADHPSNQLRDGRFPQIPILIGTNSEEGTAFGTGLGPNGTGVNTDAEFISAIKTKYISETVLKSSGKSENDIVDAILALYPNIQSVGVPSLKSWPEVVTPETEDVEALGLQYRRTNALVGDVHMHAMRRLANAAWSKAGLPSWAYRFDVTVNGVPAYTAATHFQEVAFVFYNLNGDGYAENPFANEPDSYKELALTMSTAWINFFTTLNPNGDAASPAWWPQYDTAVGGGVGQHMVWSANGSYAEMDDFRAEGINWIVEHALDIFGY